MPYWGKQYTWRLVTFNKDHKEIKDSLHHFGTILNPEMDTAIERLRIIQAAKNHKDALVFLDKNKGLYNMSGQPVWFLPGNIFLKVDVRDLKLSPFGTITFLVKDQAYEINYDGDILWKGPDNGKVSGDSSEHYHHEFTRLANGHYMILGDEGLRWTPELIAVKDCKTLKAIDNKIANNYPDIHKSMFGTLIEYDEKGNVVWDWKSSCYFVSSDLIYEDSAKPQTKKFVDVHANAFYFDEKRKVIYIGFKNISRIIKIKYPEETVMDTYGEIYKPGVPKTGNGLFCGQHSISVTHAGDLLVFNNNLCCAGPSPFPPKLMVMKEVADAGKSKLKKCWEYQCTTDDNGATNNNFHALFMSGGDVKELKDNSLFVCMGGTYSKIFILNRNKEISWSAIPEVYLQTEKRWSALPQYRANIIEGAADIQKLVLGGRN